MHSFRRGARLVMTACAMLSLGACTAIDRVTFSEFQPINDTGFVFRATSNLFYRPGVDTAAENVRLGWIEDNLQLTNLCPHGYDIVQRIASPRRTVVPSYDIVYHGRCRA